MSKSEIFIQYYIKKRIRIITHAPDELHKIYSAKYANWIVPFLNKHGIMAVPLILCCNTIYQLPDFFTLGADSFFVADYYLHEFFYDFNYSFLEPDLEEFAINLCIKTYMEKAYLKGKINTSFFLCATSPDIEEYKKSVSYRNKNRMTYLVDMSDLQEAFTFLHEAGHFLFKKIDHVQESSDYKSIIQIFSGMEIKVDKSFYEECFCDYVGITYILEKTYTQSALSHEEYFTTFFRTLTYIYAIEYFTKCQEINPSLFAEYMDDQMLMISFRFHSLYSAMYEFLLRNNQEEDIVVLKSVYQSRTEEFSKIGNEIRNLSFYIEQQIFEGSKLFHDVSNGEKIAFIKEFLNLL